MSDEAPECECTGDEMCWRCTPFGRNPRDPEWQARAAARIVLGAFAPYFEACPHGHRYEDCCWRGSLPPGGTKEGT